MKNAKRDLYYVAPEIKPVVVKKIVLYWIVCIAFATLPLMIGRIILQPDRLFLYHFSDILQHYWLMYVMFFGLLPFAVRDSMRIINRTFGPLKRLRFELSEYRTKGTYHPVNARDGDFLQEVIQEIDSLILSKVAEENRDARDSGSAEHEDELAEAAV